jgi:hypothetical protein
MKRYILLALVLLSTLIALFTYRVSFAMCRGVHCLEEHASAIHPDAVYELRDVCAVYASPTGIGLFRDRKGGSLARGILGAEYVVFSTEFLFVTFRNVPGNPVLVISDDDFSIRLNDEICAEKVFIQVSDRERLIRVRAP